MQVWVSLRVEKSDDATGCACKGQNLAQHKQNLQSSSYAFEVKKATWGKHFGTSATLNVNEINSQQLGLCVGAMWHTIAFMHLAMRFC